MERVAERFTKRPFETSLLVLGAPLLASNILTGLEQLLFEEDVSLHKRDSKHADTAASVKYRGKEFNQIVTGKAVNLGLLGVLPYFAPVCLIAVDMLALLLRGAKHELRKGAPSGTLLIYLGFAVFPLVDLISGADWSNPTKAQEHSRRATRMHFRTPLYLWCLTELIATLAVFRAVLDKRNGLTAWHRLALIVKLATFNGAFGINVSHELLHKRSKFERFLAHALLVNVNYTHWQEEHEVGHHTHVATPRDPATSAEGQTLYSFLPQTFWGTWKHRCEMEMERLGDRGWYSMDNQVLRGVAQSFCWSLVLAKWSNSLYAVPLFYLQAFGAQLLLEVINYVEHFGLERERDPVTGEYEPVTPAHSWNAPHAFSNTILFKLQRHSDHHTFPTRPYELLRNFAESPQMPCGYIGMVVLAFHPQAFFYIMTPLLEAHRLEFGSAEVRDEAAVEKLKRTARFRIWAWTMGYFTASSALLLLLTSNRRGNRQA